MARRTEEVQQVEPRIAATGCPMVEVTFYDSQGNWAGGGIVPRSWVKPSEEAPADFVFMHWALGS